MWSSLSKIAALPPNTTVYCAHEYTQVGSYWVSDAGRCNAMSAYECTAFF